MSFEPDTIYHVYNQGNNRQRIFYTDANYQYFLAKMKKYLLPYCEVLAYCLMPNHFHWLILSTKAGCAPSKAKKPYSSADTNFNPYKSWLSHSIGILLSSYAKAINKQERRTGSVFRSGTKIKNGDMDEFTTLSNSADIYFTPEIDYEQTCFAYIHNNPVKAGLVKYPIDWKFSSAREYAGMSEDPICNLKLAKELELY